MRLTHLKYTISFPEVDRVAVVCAGDWGRQVVRIVISGAGGFVAGLIIPELVARGHSLLLITRNPGRLREDFPGCDVSDLENWTQNAKEAEIFLHLAVLNNNQRANKGMFEHVNVTLAAKFAREARMLGINSFIYVSTIKTLVHSNRSKYVDTKRQGETAVRASFGPSCRVVRMGNLYGATYSGKLSFLNNLPRTLASACFSILSALIPTTRCTLLVDYIEKDAIDNSRSGYIVTDDKSQNRTYSAWSWFIDSLFVLVVLLSLPLLLALWVFIVVSEGRPGIIGQARVGEGEKSFLCWKLRTMKNGTPFQPSHEVSEDAVTSFGAFLRRLKLDELPQALNVLLREMTVIGPRPCLVNQSEVIFARRALQLEGLRPGVTGWAQVNLVDMKDPNELATMDSEYSRLRCISLDSKILLATAVGGSRKAHSGSFS